VIVASLAVIATLGATLLLQPETTVAAGHATTTTQPCSGPRFNTDFRIDQCLESDLRMMRTRMESSLREESVFLGYPSRSQDWRVAQRTQSTFLAYAREECLAQANPYQPGTIVPILFGECELQLFDQRLAYLHRTIASFKRGGESQPSS
jgi:uncharacterized protein YecT (DUF1311 family)